VSGLRTLSGAACMRNADTPVRPASGAAPDKNVRVTHVERRSQTYLLPRAECFSILGRMRCFACPVLLLILFWSCAVSAGSLARFQTPLGEIEVELFDSDKPVTVQNFIAYVQSGAYTNLFIHRWEPGFVIQAGSFYTADRQSQQPAFAAVPRFDAITNEYSVGRTFSNSYGTIAMAREPGATNSARADWFFNLGDNSFLDDVDGGFTVFGRVLRGTDVLDRFNNTDLTNGLFMATVPGLFNRLPVLAQNPTFDDLVYSKITLLTARCDLNDAGHRVISWESAPERMNRVEFTSRLPPVWEELISTNGTGQLMRVTDASPMGQARIYRIRVEY
jgi:cyclophilin family peptidyl-prolyl cis-trans isomerase